MPIDTLVCLSQDGGVTKCTFDDNGRLIVGGWFGGLYVYEGNTWKNYDTIRIETQIGISAIDLCVDKYNNKWIAESISGLIVFNENGVVTSVRTSGDMVPAGYVLFQNYPNPFNPTTIIKFQINQDEHVTLIVYDILGRNVATLLNEYKKAGKYSVPFLGNNWGNLSSGVYFYTLHVSNYMTTMKMTLLK